MDTMTRDVQLREATADDISSLAEVERSAAALFESAADLAWTSGADNVLPVEVHRRALDAGLLWVAEAHGDAPRSIVGFLTALPFERDAYIKELDVHADWQRRGIGTRLLGTLVDRARVRGLRAVTLTTFVDVPWNAPYYASLGFETLPSTPGHDHRPLYLRDMMVREQRHSGFPPDSRCAMQLVL